MDDEKVVNSFRWADLKPGDLILKSDDEINSKFELVLFISSKEDALGLSGWTEIIYLNELGEVKSHFYRSYFKLKEYGWKLVAWEKN